MLQELNENQMEVENAVLDALIDLREAEIEELQKERDAFAKAADNIISGLNDSLNKEKQLYQNDESQKEIGYEDIHHVPSDCA